MSIKFKLNIVNKYEYEKNDDYKEVVVKIPNESEELEKAFSYLELSYHNLSIQDSHIVKCEVVDTDNKKFANDITRRINNVINKANASGYTTPFQDIKSLFAIVKNFNSEEKDKLLAILEIKVEQISNMQDVIKYCDNLEHFEFHSNINSYEEYAEKLIDERDVCADDIIDFVDLVAMGEAYVNGNEGIFTDYGLVFEEYGYQVKSNNKREEEEEFEQ